MLKKTTSHLLNSGRADERQAMVSAIHYLKTNITSIDIFHDGDDDNEIELTVINRILN